MTKSKSALKKSNIKLQRHIDNKDFLKVVRTTTDGRSDINGFLLKISRKYILIQKEEEFILNGYAITPIDHFNRIRCNKWDKAHKKMLKAEGITDKFLGIDKNINLTSWKTIFSDLRKFDYHVIVECEDLKEPSFTIGPVKKVNKASVGVLYYDPSGLLDKKPTFIKYDDITLVQFGHRYVEVFRKYLRTSNGK